MVQFWYGRGPPVLGTPNGPSQIRRRDLQMAVASIPVPPDAKRDERASKLAPFVGSWPRFVLKQPWGSFEAGTEFRRAPSSRNQKIRYLVNTVACQYPDYAQHGNVCKHVRAVVLWEASQQPAPTAPRPW